MSKFNYKDYQAMRARILAQVGSEEARGYVKSELDFLWGLIVKSKSGVRER